MGPEHVALAERGRVEYTTVGDGEAVAAFHQLARCEGILPALESAHALAEAARRAPRLGDEKLILVNLSGRGDKDLESVLAFDHQQAEAAAAPATAGPVHHGAVPAEAEEELP